MAITIWIIVISGIVGILFNVLIATIVCELYRRRIESDMEEFVKDYIEWTLKR